MEAYLYEEDMEDVRLDNEIDRRRRMVVEDSKGGVDD